MPEELFMCTVKLSIVDREENKNVEKEMATHSSSFAWRIPWKKGAWQATVHKVARSWT